MACCFLGSKDEMILFRCFKLNYVETVVYVTDVAIFSDSGGGLVASWAKSTQNPTSST